MARTAPKTGDHDAAGTIPVDVAAKLLMVTPEWVRRLTKDGWIAKTDRGRYRVVDVVQGYIRFLKDEARRSSKTASLSRLQDIRTRKEELAVAQTERELVPLVEAMTLVDEVAGAVVARINAIPARLTRNIEQREQLQREVDDALTEVADRIAKLGRSYRADDEDPAAEEEGIDGSLVAREPGLSALLGPAGAEGSGAHPLHDSVHAGLRGRALQHRGVRLRGPDGQNR
jgi:hypothetical protein